MLVVWEPILAIDWSSPSRSTLARISDRRARQYWDPRHLVSQDLSRVAQQHPDRGSPPCCRGKGFFWDDVLIYPRGSLWHDAPASAFWNGPIVKVVPGFENAFRELK